MHFTPVSYKGKHSPASMTKNAPKPLEPLYVYPLHNGALLWWIQQSRWREPSALGPNPNQNLNCLARREELFNAFLRFSRLHDLKTEHWDVHICQGSFKQLRTTARTEGYKYTEAWDAFKRRDDNADALNHLRYMNCTRDGAPKIAPFGKCLSGTFQRGGKTSLTAVQKKKFPAPATSGSLSNLAARQRWLG